MSTEAALPLEHFIQAVQSQLDNAQTAMAVKARNSNLPLTFAIKDITLDLRAHVEFARSEIRIRPAGAGDKEASVFHLVFTAITRPMIEENAIAFSETPEDRSIDGMAFYAALELQDQITKMIELLSDKDIMSAYGARDMWQVIDQVATLELGGARNSARYRTMATCGAIITAWLANNVKRYNTATSQAIINVDEVLSLDPPTAGSKATTEPTDYDLVNACELWLSDTATSDDRIEQLSQPREAPVMTSRPVQIPSIAREMLEQAGVPGFGFGMGQQRH